MIVDLILVIVQGILEVLLLPLSGLNFVIDVSQSIPVLSDFFNIIAYVLPWSNMLPLLMIVIGVFIFRITMAVIKAVWHFTPGIGN